MKQYKEHQKQNAYLNIRIWIAILSTALAIIVGITIWTFFFKDTTPILAPDYAPHDEEINAEPYNGEETAKMEQQQGGGAVSLTYSKDVSVDLSEQTVKLLFANPAKSNQNILIQIIVHDTVIVQSGLLMPGNQVTKLDLWDTAKLSTGQYDGRIVVFYYQPDSGEKAMINTEIPLTVTVNE